MPLGLSDRNRRQGLRKMGARDTSYPGPLATGAQEDESTRTKFFSALNFFRTKIFLSSPKVLAGFSKENVRYPVFICRDPTFSHSGYMTIILSYSRDLIFHSGP